MSACGGQDNHQARVEGKNDLHVVMALKSSILFQLPPKKPNDILRGLVSHNQGETSHSSHLNNGIP